MHALVFGLLDSASREMTIDGSVCAHHRSLEQIHLWHSSALPRAGQERVPLVLIDSLVKQTSYQLIRCVGWGGALKTAPVIEHWQHREQDKEVHP